MVYDPDLFVDLARSVPPNGISVNDTLFVDQTEVSNIGYREFQFYIKTKYGVASVEYINTILLETKFDEEKSYQSDTEYDNHPVVGVSQSQAVNFARWRSDRVMELILIDRGALDFCDDCEGDEVFTIERYFDWEYLNRPPDPRVLYYPQFRLPAMHEIEFMRSEMVGYISVEDSLCIYDAPFTGDMPRPKYTGMEDCDIHGVLNLYDNVTEWSATPQQTYGYHYASPEEERYNEVNYMMSSENQYTGFRNVCQWMPVSTLNNKYKSARVAD